MSDFLDVELFLIANGRLPTKPDDSLTEKMVKNVIDKAHQGDKKALSVLSYAFHKFGLMRCKGGKNCPNHADHEGGRK